MDSSKEKVVPRIIDYIDIKIISDLGAEVTEINSIKIKSTKENLKEYLNKDYDNAKFDIYISLK